MKKIREKMVFNWHTCKKKIKQLNMTGHNFVQSYFYIREDCLIKHDFLKENLSFSPIKYMDRSKLITVFYVNFPFF